MQECILWAARIFYYPSLPKFPIPWTVGSPQFPPSDSGLGWTCARGPDRGPCGSGIGGAVRRVACDDRSPTTGHLARNFLRRRVAGAEGGIARNSSQHLSEAGDAKPGSAHVHIRLSYGAAEQSSARKPALFWGRDRATNEPCRPRTACGKRRLFPTPK